MTPRPTKAEKATTLAISMPPELAQRLRSTAEAQGRPLASIVRTLIEDGLKSKSSPNMQAEYLDPRSIPVNQLLHRIRQIHMDETYKQRAVTQAEKAEVVRSLKPLLKMGFPEYVRLRGFHPEWDRGTTALVTVQDEWNLMGVFYESNGGTVVGIT